MTKAEVSELTADKLNVIETAMLSMYPELWARRWPTKQFVAYWGPMVEPLTAVQVAKATVDIVRHRKEPHPPQPAEFLDLARAYAPPEPRPAEIERTPMSPANRALLDQLKRDMGIRT